MKIKHFKFAPVIGFGYWKDIYKLGMSEGYCHNIILPFVRMQIGQLNPIEKVCEHEGCGSSDPIICTIDGEVHQLLCGYHAAEYGFCSGCGVFSAGITSFDFHHPGLCDNCHDQLSSDFDFEDDDDFIHPDEYPYI